MLNIGEDDNNDYQTHQIIDDFLMDSDDDILFNLEILNSVGSILKSK